MKYLIGCSVLAILMATSGCWEDVKDLPPKACLMVDNNAPVTGQPVTFTDCSEDAYRIEIHFGDGTFSRSSVVQHSYTAAGTYQASLFAWNKDNSLKTESIQIITVREGSIQPPDTNNTTGILPTACFTPTPAVVEAGTEILFINCSINAASFSWNFGDGSTSSLQNPTHTFDSAGTYQVKLTASNQNGSDDTTIAVTVGQRILQTVILKNFNPLNPSGTAWDDMGFPIPGFPVEPDVFVELTSASGSNLTTSVRNNLATSALPVSWNVASSNLTLKEENWTVIIWDDEGFLGADEEMMRWDNVNLGTMGGSGKIELTSGSYALELVYVVQ
ncbi:MAG: hypothetical protein KatS3mg031_0488 [Chitinophagales bacterium]|nr:MAG: hypothetical protein KatS3mg031_0488 [Chitinophagales bacterium]